MLARELVDLPDARLDDLPLDEPMREAIRLAQRIRSREGRRRQIHYVGKLMRQADVSALRQRMAYWSDQAAAGHHALQRLEALRDELLENDEALERLHQRFAPDTLQALRARVRAARSEAASNATLSQGREPARKHYRALFQALKQLNWTEEDL